jgi:hypothetical protein
MRFNFVRRAIIVWTLIFFCVILPFVSLYINKVEDRPVVTAEVTNAHEVIISTEKLNPWIVADLDFDRPTADGLAHCHLKDFKMGQPNTPGAYASVLQLAVHPYSCYEPVRLPFRTPGFAGWTVIYLIGCIIASIWAFGAAKDLQKQRRRKQEQSSSVET